MMIIEEIQTQTVKQRNRGTPNPLTEGKFAEELYFMLISSSMRDRIEALAQKYGLSRKELKDNILLTAERFGQSIDLATRETVYAPAQ
ncbi:MAG: hypothetical protein JW828_00825 [Sedimentisphaerales bacterium]|nr:hypothetical protein [Sedimentisphaerales bacterium]